MPNPQGNLRNSKPNPKRALMQQIRYILDSSDIGRRISADKDKGNEGDVLKIDQVIINLFPSKMSVRLKETVESGSRQRASPVAGRNQAVTAAAAAAVNEDTEYVTIDPGHSGPLDQRTNGVEQPQHFLPVRPREVNSPRHLQPSPQDLRD